MPDNIYNHLEIVRYQSSINIHLCTQFFFNVLYCINLNKKIHTITNHCITIVCNKINAES